MKASQARRAVTSEKRELSSTSLHDNSSLISTLGIVTKVREPGDIWFSDSEPHYVGHRLGDGMDPEHGEAGEDEEAVLGREDEAGSRHGRGESLRDDASEAAEDEQEEEDRQEGRPHECDL